MSLDNAEKLERVRTALRRGDITEAAKDAKVFELLPLEGEWLRNPVRWFY